MPTTISGSQTGTIGIINTLTAQASTSGTAINFTGIPSGARRVTVMFSGVSTNGVSDLLVQVGTSGGVASTGYISTGNVYNQSNGTGGSNSTAGFLIRSNSASNIFSGAMVILLLGSNVWVSYHTAKSLTNGVVSGGGDVTLGGTLDRVRITTVNGTDTFDAGSINVLYE